jgi:hypothetical protein
VFDEMGKSHFLLGLLQHRTGFDLHALQVWFQGAKVLARQTCKNSISDKGAIIAADVRHVRDALVMNETELSNHRDQRSAVGLEANELRADFMHLETM